MIQELEQELIQELEQKLKQERNKLEKLELGYRKLNGIRVSNYTLNEYFRGLDGFQALKIKKSAHDAQLPSSNDMKSIWISFSFFTAETNYYKPT